MNKFVFFYDVVICGGGIIGGTFALSLARSGFTVLLIEKNSQMFCISENNIPDLKVLAINHNTVNFLTELNLIQCIDSMYRIPYRYLETWEIPKYKVTFDATDINLPTMGLIIEHRKLQSVIWNACNQCDNLVLIYAVVVTSIEYKGIYWQVLLSNGTLILSYLLIGADGKQSTIRQLSKIDISGWKYPQSCMLFIAKVEKYQIDTVWQMITPSGPKGCLPLYNNWVSLMWYDDTMCINQLQQLSLPILEKYIQNVFVEKLGKIKLYKYGVFSLFFQYAHYYIRPGLALIGDAAHCIHPLAGQGINLGFRDIKILSEILIDAKHQNKRWNSMKFLEQYQSNCKYNNFLMQFGTNLFYLIFSHENFYLKIMRNYGFGLINRSNFCKKKILQFASGILEFKFK